MFIKFLKWIDRNDWRIALVMAPVTILLMILPAVVPALRDINFLDYNIFSLATFLCAFIMAGLWSGVAGDIIFNYASDTEKEKQKIVSQFNVKQAQIVSEILKEKDDEKKKELEKQAQVLRQEYESRMSENLRRKDGTFVTDWREVLLVARKRLADEEQRLLARNRANLRNGILMAFVGVGLPAFYIFFDNSTGTPSSVWLFIVAYLPALSIVFIFETVAIFYLRLYALTERRIERNKNELTNIELRLTSGLMLWGKEEVRGEPALFSLSNHIAKEERNFVLGKNESSAGVSSNKLLEILSKLVSRGTS